MAGGSRQVFISYARGDAEPVDALVEGLRQLHYDAWVDRELTGGQAWWDTVLSQIRASSAALIALSPAALESIAVQREYEYAHAVGRPLLPVVIDRVQLETLPSLLAPLQVVDYCQPDMKSAFALAAALTALPTPRALPRPLPEPPPIPVSYLGGLKERSQAPTLSMDEQLALVARLKAALGHAGEREAAEEVLRSLQGRHDLYQVSAREIETLLPPLVSPADRPPPAAPTAETPRAAPRKSSTEKPRGSPAPAETPEPSQPVSSTGKWRVKELVRSKQQLVLEVRGHDRHTLEYRWTYWSDPILLDGKKVAGLMATTGTRTFEFEDGGEKVCATVNLETDFKLLKSFVLSLDSELVYRFQ